MTKAATKDDLFNKKAITKPVYFIADPDLAQQWSEAQEAVESLRLTPWSADYTQALAEVERLRPLVKEATRKVTLKAIGRGPYDKLMDAHPPTDEQITEAKERGDGEPRFNPEAFFPALLAAAFVEPKLTEKEAKERILDSPEYNTGEANNFVLTAMRLNNQTSTVSLGKEFEGTPGSELSSTTAPL